MTEKKIIKPALLGGFRDLLPSEAIKLREVAAKIVAVYERFGFVPLETPCMERWDVLTGDDPDFNKSIFRAQVARGAEDKDQDIGEGENFALRFDLTVPLARVVAAYPKLPRPFKRWQLGRVFRGERPQAGRFREFYQLDFDTIGANSVTADAEVIQVMYEVMKALGIENFLIRFNTRRVLNGLAEMVGCGGKAKEVFRIIDKLDKVGLDGVLQELRRQPDNQFDENALALSEEQAAKVRAFLELKSDNADELLRQLTDFFGAGDSPSGNAGVEELATIVQILTSLNIPQRYWRLDLSVARGLDYYTGPVFETTLTDCPELGSVLSGGRFDGLTDRFMEGSNIAGVGASVGVDRLLVGMEKLGLVSQRQSVSQVLVTVFNAELEMGSLKLAQELRQAGVNAEVYLGNDATLRAQLAYATRQEIPLVVVIGPDEAARGQVQLKNMAERRQELLTKEELLAKLKA
jgi:histidyl-tRNA synthetase